MGQKIGWSGVNRSRKAARYGSLAEKWAAERYGLELERDSWHDARKDDRPADVKAAMNSRNATRFRLWEEQHRRLRREDGFYVFILYRPVGRGIDVLRSRTIAARSLRVRFGGAGNHPKGNQAKIPSERIFS
jgi:hypothetical protein